MKTKLFFLLVLCVFTLSYSTVGAQDELAAVLEVRSGGVEVQRVNTQQWIPVRVEAIVGVGDTIRTDGRGRARVIFFADGTDTDLLPDTEYRIEKFQGNDQAFQLTVSVLAGQTVQRLNRLVDANSSYDINTPGMELVARGTIFRVRVEDSGRAAMLVDQGLVAATADGAEAEVANGLGVRSAVNESLSDVVKASTFEQLDAALDGCRVEVTTADDVRLNVRIAPNLQAPRVGTIGADEIEKFIGVVESGDWYRIDFNGGFGWVLASKVRITEAGCAGLRSFPNNHGPEDATRYESLGEEIELPTDLAPEDAE